MSDDDYQTLADELLTAIPERMWDQRLLEQAMTPREAAEHVAAGGCLACRMALEELSNEEVGH